MTDEAKRYRALRACFPVAEANRLVLTTQEADGAFCTYQAATLQEFDDAMQELVERAEYRATPTAPTVDTPLKCPDCGNALRHVAGEDWACSRCKDPQTQSGERYWRVVAPTAAEREGEGGAIDWLRTVVNFGEKRGDLTLTLGTHLLRNALAAHDAALLAAEREGAWRTEEKDWKWWASGSGQSELAAGVAQVFALDLMSSLAALLAARRELADYEGQAQVTEMFVKRCAQLEAQWDAARREVEAARADAERWAIVQDRALDQTAATRRENEALRRALDSVRAEVSNGNRTASARFGTVTAIVDAALAATPEEKK